MMRVENQHSKCKIVWDEVDEVRQRVGSRDKVKHIERNDHL